MDRLRETLGKSAIAGDIRGRGLLFGVEIVADRDTRQPDPEKAEQIYYACLAEGLSFKVSGGNILTLSPPLTIAESELGNALGIVERAVKSAE